LLELGLRAGWISFTDLPVPQSELYAWRLVLICVLSDLVPLDFLFLLVLLRFPDYQRSDNLFWILQSFGSVFSALGLGSDFSLMDFHVVRLSDY
jgi:hypothetical protein